jgi:hypothetical protein
LKHARNKLLGGLNLRRGDGQSQYQKDQQFHQAIRFHGGTPFLIIGLCLAGDLIAPPSSYNVSINWRKNQEESLFFLFNPPGNSYFYNVREHDALTQRNLFWPFLAICTAASSTPVFTARPPGGLGGALLCLWSSYLS